MNYLSFKHLLVFSVFSVLVITAVGQTKMPDELSSSSIKDQLKYVEDHTRIYDNFRAVREDIFQKINKNYIDTLQVERGRIKVLQLLTTSLNSKTDSLNALLVTTRINLNEAISSKDSIQVLGMELNKGAYNAIMWILVGGLVLILLIGFLIFKRNLVVLLTTSKDLKELKEEFAAYKQSSRLAREKVEMDLFRANQKLKGN